MRWTKSFFRFLICAALRVLIAAIVGTGLLTAAYLLPTDAMSEHLDSSAQILLQEGTYPQIFPWCTSQLDNYTDAIILMNASYNSGKSPLIQAMTAARPNICGITVPTEALAAHYNSGIPYDMDTPYYQYWHGYLLFVKPLLLLTDYSGIRTVNSIVQGLMLILLLMLMVKRNLARYIFAYLLSLAFLMPVALALSLQFSSCYYIMTLGAITVLLMKDSLEQKDASIFLLIGISTAYFDFLTYPIATFGIPAAFYFCVQERTSLGVSFKKGGSLLFSWGFGYSAMWACKWLIGTVVTSQNVLSIASAKLAERSCLTAIQSTGLFSDLRTALFQNIKAFFHTPATFLFAAVVVVLALLIAIRLRRSGLKDLASVSFPYVILACMPPAWYLIASNHSSIHYWFTNKSLAVSAFSALCALIKSWECIRNSTYLSNVDHASCPSSQTRRKMVTVSVASIEKEEKHENKRN